MTKYWQAGLAKTRLGQTLGMDRAAALHRCFVLHLCRTLASLDARRVLCVTPEAQRPLVAMELNRQGLEGSWETMPQGEGTLGNRIEAWFDSVLGQGTGGTQRAILIGADCPTLSPDLIRQADRELRSHQVVLGPARDGGYYLIGISVPWSVPRFHSLFDPICWGTDRVLEQTRHQLSRTGISWKELEPQEDIDTMPQLNRLLQHLRSGTGHQPTGGDRVESSHATEKLRETIETLLQSDPRNLVSSEHSA